MKFQGTITEVFPLMEMTINEKPSKKVEFLLEYEGGGQFSKNIVVEAWNEKAENSNIVIGNRVEVEVNLKTRKAGSRFYNNITANRIDLIQDKAV